METATQALHRLTSYDPGTDWDEPADHPRAVRNLESNDLARFPWFFKRYVQSLPGVPEYASATGGPPGAPTAARKVVER